VKRPRTSTLILCGIFVATLVLYLAVRPDPAPEQETQLVPAVRVPVAEVEDTTSTSPPPATRATTTTTEEPAERSTTSTTEDGDGSSTTSTTSEAEGDGSTTTTTTAP
jgi:hypothetical protein